MSHWDAQDVDDTIPRPVDRGGLEGQSSRSWLDDATWQRWSHRARRTKDAIKTLGEASSALFVTSLVAGYFAGLEKRTLNVAAAVWLGSIPTYTITCILIYDRDKSQVAKPWFWFRDLLGWSGTIACVTLLVKSANRFRKLSP